MATIKSETRLFFADSHDSHTVPVCPSCLKAMGKTEDELCGNQDTLQWQKCAQCGTEAGCCPMLTVRLKACIEIRPEKGKSL